MLIKMFTVTTWLLLSISPATFAATLPQGKFVNDQFVGSIHHPEWFKETFFDLADDLQTALAANKKGLMLMFTTQGCSYCAMFVEKSLSDPTISKLTQKYFDTLGLEIFDDAEMTDFQGNALRVKEFASKIGAGMAPSLFFYGADGEQLMKVVGYQAPERFTAILEYLGEHHHEKSSFRSFLASRSSTQPTSGSSYHLKHDELFATPPYALDRSRFAATSPLLVIFEKNQCAECETFHQETLAKPAVRELLQQLEVVRLDAEDNSTPVLKPDGSRTTPAAWYAESTFSRLPALSFFSEQGKNVLQTDALVLEGRMLNSTHFVLQRAYDKGWNYQRFARSQAIAKNLASATAEKNAK